MWSLISPLTSPKKFFYLSRKIQPWILSLFVITFIYGVIGGLFLAPPDYIQGDAFRIIYVHVPAAFLSLFIYAIMAAAAFCSIVFRLKLAFLVIRESAPLGASFTLLALLSGSLWGKPMWGTWWIWDARLTSELILLFLYLSILLFQSAISHKQSGERLLALFILVGFIDIPIIHYSVYWWNTLHQGATLSLFAQPKIDTSMLYPLLSMIFAFLFYYMIVLFLRIRYELISTFANQHWLLDKR
ncbi:MAG: heme ABC transporter permease [Gammaproteobacteria bacterium RIFCSPHIGHO2_12_FULL_38_14]|nr:MAG: heme ABC transporter permease [Gammaproteobacteria bacterium RIFCSPHIGHO2_12_FULL_38_14]